MQTATLFYLVNNGNVFLGLKQEKLGSGKYNGFGGRVDPGETIEQAALRELSEETDRVKATEYRYAGCITYVFPKSPEWDQHVHIYVATKWEGEPRTTREMKDIQQFPIQNLRFERMWDNDKYWLQHVLKGGSVSGIVTHDGTNTLSKELELRAGDGNL